MDDSKTVWLDITSFRGFSIGQHYYGRLEGQHYGDKDVSLRKTLTSKEAKYLTRHDGNGYTYHKGDTSSRFDTVEEIREAALKALKENFPRCELLIEGGRVVAQPELVIFCSDPNDQAQMNKLFREGEALCGWDWDKDPRVLQRLSDEWQIIADKYGWSDRIGVTNEQL